MNITLAQLRKDIQCQRGLLIAWAICVGLSILPFTLFWLIPHCFTFSHTNPGTVMVYVLAIGGTVMGCAVIVALGLFILLPLLVIRIVHEDVLMGTTAFWRTRPISREKLLSAKAILILSLLIPPLLLAEITNTSMGSGQFWATNLALIAAFAAVASITAGARDFMIYAAVLVFGKGIFASGLKTLWGHFHDSRIAMADAGFQQFSIFTRTLHLGAPDFYHLCYFVGFAAVFIHQYLTLRTKTSLALMIGVIAVISFLQILVGAPIEAPAVH
jgi:hypothetical protein